VGLGPFHQYRFTFVSLKTAQKWLSFRGRFSSDLAEKIFASSSPKDAAEVHCYR